MTQTETVFSQETPAPSGTTTTPSNPPTGDAFLEVEGRKFSSKEDVVKKIVNADKHIETLELERKADRDKLKELESKVSQLQTLEEVLARKQGELEREPAQTAIDPAKLVEMAAQEVLGALGKKEQDALMASNFAHVNSVVTAKFGAQADAEVFKRAAEAGYSRDEAIALAKTKPKAFLKLLDLEDKKPSVDPRPTLSGTRPTPTPTKERGKWWEGLDSRSTKERIAALDRIEKERGLAS